jgi:hypothetical protein
MLLASLEAYRQRAKGFVAGMKEGLFDARLAAKMAEIYIPDLCKEIERLQEIEAKYNGLCK